MRNGGDRAKYIVHDFSIFSPLCMRVLVIFALMSKNGQKFETKFIVNNEL